MSWELLNRASQKKSKHKILICKQFRKLRWKFQPHWGNCRCSLLKQYSYCVQYRHKNCTTCNNFTTFPLLVYLGQTRFDFMLLFVPTARSVHLVQVISLKNAFLHLIICEFCPTLTFVQFIVLLNVSGWKTVSVMEKRPKRLFSGPYCS
jgi:hypothetical protein